MSKARDLGDAANKANFLDNVTSDIQSQLTALSFPAGTIITFGGTSAPTGYLACEGQQVLQSEYPNLYAAIGTTWGSAAQPAVYFKLPDLRGAFLRGTGSHGTSNMANGNDFAGQAVGSFENDQMQDHRHSMPSAGGSGHSNPTKFFQIQTGNNGYYANTFYLHASSTSTATDDSASGGHRAGDETRPFNASILYCIKT